MNALRIPPMQWVSFTTPPVDEVRAKSLRLVKHYRDIADIVVTGSTDDNAENLAGGFISRMEIANAAQPDVLAIERHGEIMDNPRFAIWNKDYLRHIDYDEALRLSAEVVISLDPAVSERHLDETGIVVVGLDTQYPGIPEKRSYVLGDYSGYPSPEETGAIISREYRKYVALGKRVRVLAETNQGGAYITNLLVNHSVPRKHIITIHQSRGKAVRFAPTVGLYAAEQVYHVPGLNNLEEQMLEWTPTAKDRHDDRVDALSTALHWGNFHEAIR